MRKGLFIAMITLVILISLHFTISKSNAQRIKIPISALSKSPDKFDGKVLQVGGKVPNIKTGRSKR